MLLETAADLAGLVVDGRVEPQLVHQPGAFVRPAGDADHLATHQLGDLAHDRTRGPGRAGDHHRVAGLGLAHLDEGQVGRLAGAAQHAQRRGRRHALGNPGQPGAVQHRDLAPAGGAGHQVTRREVRVTRFQDLAQARARHQAADLHRVHIAGDILHPALLRRIEGQPVGAQLHLPLAHRRHSRRLQPPVIFAEGPADRPGGHHPLPAGRGHWLNSWIIGRRRPGQNPRRLRLGGARAEPVRPRRPRRRCRHGPGRRCPG